MTKYNTPDEVLEKLRQITNPAFAFDLDGTLLDIAPTPEDVVIAPYLSQMVMDLSQMSGGAAAIISGREMNFIDSLFPQRPPASSSHGIVIRRTLGGQDERQVSSPNVALLSSMLTDMFNQNGLTHAGCKIEVKQDGCALHYRAATLKKVAGHVEAIAQSACKIYKLKNSSGGPDLDITFGEMVVEIGPHGLDKGTALNAIRATKAFQNKAVIYCGDTHADKPAIDALQPGDVSIGIGPTLSGKTDFLLQSPGKLHQVLRKLPELMHK